ncbi:MAG: ABC transporter ATP-binding protein [Alicyclobacillus sp.]|nr:ABC transporter ATP-binding protein [Alicyclobacillus sp.]
MTARAEEVPLLRVRGLATWFVEVGRVTRAVNGVDLTVWPGQVVGLVGESGSGKSVTALSILRLVPPPGRVVAGEVWLQGCDLLRLPERALRAIRGRDIGYIAQDPLAALNPVLTVGAQVAEVLRRHLRATRRQAWLRALELLEQAGLAPASALARAYPHQLSGGQRQRVLWALALACRPPLLLADEPTTALDATLQADLLARLQDWQRQTGSGVLLITHDLAVVAAVADVVAVMYAGQLVEWAAVEQLGLAPLHPYSQQLWQAAAHLYGGVAQAAKPAVTAAGAVAADEGGAAADGCRFAPRCPYVLPRCVEQPPPWREVQRGHWVRCALV